MEEGSSEGKTRRARILFVHHRSELGGAPTSLSYLIRELDREQFEPHVYCPPGAAAHLFEAAGATVHTGAVSSFTHIWASVYRGRRWLLFLRELALLGAHLRDFGRTLREQRYDLVHVNDSPLIPAALLARRHGLPVVWHLRSSLPFDGTDPRSRLVRLVIRRVAAEAIAINQEVASVFEVDATVVPNSVDIARFRPGDATVARKALGLALETPVISFFGFIYPSKGFREFIRAAARLRELGIEAHCLVVGGAVRGQEFFRTIFGRGLLLADLTRDYETEAKGLVRALGLEDVVHFIPFTQDTADLYRASDVVVAPSLGPELGRPVIEAAASGIAVVASGSKTGAGIVVADETGVLVPNFRLETLAQAIAGLLEDPERRRRIGTAARVHAEHNFDARRNARRVEQVYRRILQPGGRIPVLYVHHRPQLGGAPSSLAQLIANLDQRYEPHVLCPEGAAARLFAEAGAIVHTGNVAIFSHAWDSPYRGLRWLVLGRELAALPAHLLQLDRLLRQYRFRLVHLNDSPLVVAAWVADRSGAHIVWHLRSALASEGRDRLSRQITGFMERHGDAAIAIDRDVAERFPMRLPLSIVHNSVALPAAGLPDPATGKERLGLPRDRVAVGFAGFIRRQKGWQELVAAAEILIREGVPVHFVVMGGGVRPPEYFRTARGRALELASLLSDEETAINDLVDRVGLREHFSFLPFTSNTGEVYNALDVVTFPNQGVGLGRPVLEAAMYGKPVVASGSRDGAGVLLPGETGILVHDATPAALASALRQLVCDAELRERLGEAAARHARHQFDPVRNAEAVAAVYDSLLGIAPPQAAEEADEPLPAVRA